MSSLPGDSKGTNVKVQHVLRIGCGFLLGSIAIAGIWLYFWLFYRLPSPEKFKAYITSTYGASEYRPASLAEIPDAMRWATLAAEDRHFYTRSADWGLKDVLRATWFAFQGDKYLVDGYSIPTGLVRNLMSVSEQSTKGTRQWWMRELMLTILITQRYTKDEILEFYLNSSYYGDGVYGVGTAAQAYYSKPIGDLDLAECTMLVSIQMSGTSLSEDLTMAKQRQLLVLDAMVRQGYISQEEANLAREETLFVR
jgi:membrane peptidoglycan carboxypeptidase